LSRETHVLDPDPRDARGASAPRTPVADSDPLAGLPRLSLPHVRLERWLQRWGKSGRLPPALTWLEESTGAPIYLEKPELIWRASGLQRPALFVQLSAPRLATRLALGIEIPVAHAIVDRLLGFNRSFGESRLQLSPVEWGVWTFLVLRALDSLEGKSPSDQHDSPGAPARAGPGHLTLDRVGPDPFDPSGLGSIVTIRWSVRSGAVEGAVRLWVPEPLLHDWQAASPAFPAIDHAELAYSPGTIPGGAKPQGLSGRGNLSSVWFAEAGLADLPQGLGRLRVGGVLPFTETCLTGSPRSPTGHVDLVLDLDDPNIRCRIPARPVADSGARLLCIEADLLHEPRPRGPTALTRNERSPMSHSPASSNAPAAGAAPLDVPVTLTVELGRVNLSVTRLADLKPGDVVELGRHSRAPVELTSSGRLVARGELVLIDTDLGVRVTNVFL
jgi:flagellar motor switch protein FliN/FliY